jgi:two-component sensor histidine kinase
MKLAKACLLGLLPFMTLAQALDLGAEINMNSKTNYMQKEKNTFISKTTTGSGTVNARALLIDGTTETTLFAQKEELTDLGESQNKRCFGVEESFELAKKTLNFKVKAYCALEKAELDRITDYIIAAGAIQEFTNRGISLDQLSSSVLEMIKGQVMADDTSRAQIDMAVNEYLKQKYSIDGKEISINDARDEIRVNIDRKIKLGNLVKEGSLFKKKVVSFDLDANEMSDIYKITLPLFASEAVDSLELANFMLTKKIKSVSAEFYNNLNISKFSCKRDGSDFNCDSDMQWDIGFKAQNKE